MGCALESAIIRDRRHCPVRHGKLPFRPPKPRPADQLRGPLARQPDQLPAQVFRRPPRQAPEFRHASAEMFRPMDFNHRPPQPVRHPVMELLIAFIPCEKPAKGLQKCGQTESAPAVIKKIIDVLPQPSGLLPLEEIEAGERPFSPGKAACRVARVFPLEALQQMPRKRQIHEIEALSPFGVEPVTIPGANRHQGARSQVLLPSIDPMISFPAEDPEDLREVVAVGNWWGRCLPAGPMKMKHFPGRGEIPEEKPGVIRKTHMKPFFAQMEQLDMNP